MWKDMPRICDELIATMVCHAYTIAMPEAGCLGKAHLDIQSKAGIPGSSGLSVDHPSEHGTSSKLCVFYISANILARATSFS
jgi:hypothetical protein